LNEEKKYAREGVEDEHGRRRNWGWVFNVQL
jgi:hypothetical protein